MSRSPRWRTRWDATTDQAFQPRLEKVVIAPCACLPDNHVCGAPDRPSRHTRRGAGAVQPGARHRTLLCTSRP
eukprot:5050210-Prymnesium_polylepis.1